MNLALFGWCVKKQHKNKNKNADFSLTCKDLTKISCGTHKQKMILIIKHIINATKSRAHRHKLNVQLMWRKTQISLISRD